MSKPQPPPSDAVSICHEESQKKFRVTFASSEGFSLNKLLRRLVPKVWETIGNCDDALVAVLSYRDEEDDLIPVTNDSELTEAVRIALLRQLPLNIKFVEKSQGKEGSLGLDSSISASAVICTDSSSDAQIDCENDVPNSAPDVPCVPVQESTNPVFQAQPAASLQTSVDLIPRIVRIEQAIQQQRVQLSDAVEDINRAHAQDRIQLSQANKECMTVVEEVRHEFLEASSRLDLLEAAHLDLKSAAALRQDAVAACLSDAAARSAAVQDLQRNLQQLQLSFDSAHQKSQQELCSSSFVNEIKVQCQEMQLQLQSIQQEQLRHAHLEHQHNLFSDRLSVVEQSALQFRDIQNDLQQKHKHLEQQLEQFWQRERDEMQRLVEGKFGELSQRLATLEARGDNYTAIQQLLSSDNEPLPRSSDITADISSSYVVCRPPLQVVSVSVSHHNFRQELQLHANGDGVCHADEDFSVSFGVNALTVLSFEVEFENVSNSIVPEDVELRLVFLSPGVARPLATMHRNPRTTKAMGPKDKFTFAVCCCAPPLRDDPSRFLWQPYSAGHPIGSSLAVYLESRS